MKSSQLAGIAFVLGIAGFATYQASQRMGPDEVRGIIAAANQSQFGGWFNEADVLALIEIESSFRPNAARWEAHKGEASLGLMQILPSSAHDRGYTGGPAGLMNPATNILYGMAHLKWGHDFLATRLGHPPDVGQWVGAYNAGVGNILKGNIPLTYVGKWARARGNHA